MSSNRAPISERFVLGTADDVNGTVDNTQALDISGADAVIIVQENNGTLGTAGVDVIEISFDGGSSFVAATAANIDHGHGGLLAEDGSKAAATNAALNAAGVEPVNAAYFSLQGIPGQVAIRCARLTTTTSGTTWVTGAPSVYAFVVGGNPAFLV